MNLDELQHLKKPVLNYEKVEVTDSNLLEELVFPNKVLAPVGTFNDKYEEEMKQAEEEFAQQMQESEASGKKSKMKKPQVKLINSELLQEKLNERTLVFYEYEPKKENIVEEYGAKYILVEDKYHGFGFYSFLISSGTKVRKQNGDRRFFEVNNEVPTLKEEIYIYYKDEFEEDDEDKTPGFKRISKKNFNELLQKQVQQVKYHPETRKLIRDYKKFFNSVILSPLSFTTKVAKIKDEGSDRVGNYATYTQTFKNNFDLMEKYYLYYNILGALKEQEYQFIKSHISELKKRVMELHNHIGEQYSNDLHKTMSDVELLDKEFKPKYKRISEFFVEMTKPNYWFNVYTGEFHRNIITFYKSYVPTEYYDDKQIEEKRKMVTAFNYIMTFYLNYGSIEVFFEKKTVSLDGWQYDSLTDVTDPTNLNKKIEDGKIAIEKLFQHHQRILDKYPQYNGFKQYLQEKEELPPDHETK